jgi:sigma-B regulation protein RsbU (phosphoserine phosphatase)
MRTPEKTDVRILLLEDSDIDAELLIRELDKRGIFFVSHRVQTRPEFTRAIEEFQPELILADYKLPGFNGSQALSIARQCCPDVPVIIVSGAVGEETAVELLKDGATDFVLKDRLSGRLVPAIHRAMREVAERDSRRQAEAALRALNAQLEERVAERTSELAAKNALMAEDLEMARELQMSFLPNRFPTLPRGATQAASAVKFSSILHPTNSVSGDYYNIAPISDTSVGIFICDVTGHGVRAALVTAMMRTLEEQLSGLAADPGALFTQMNRSLRGILGHLGTSLFTTACYLIVDIASGRLSFVNAGHPSPLLLREATGEVELISERNTSGPALGLFDDTRYQTHELTVDAGDLLLVFTDGLFKAVNPQAETFGISRLREAVRRQAGLPLAKVIQDVFTEVETFTDSQPFTDDICIIGMEILHLEKGDSKRPQPGKHHLEPARAAMA